MPLLLFAAASRRLPLIYMGFIQYFAPFIQFLVGVFVLQEPMPPERWVGFGLVWLALIVLTFDLVRGVRDLAQVGRRADRGAHLTPARMRGRHPIGGHARSERPRGLDTTIPCAPRAGRCRQGNDSHGVTRL